MPLGNPQAYTQQGMSPQQAQAKAFPQGNPSGGLRSAAGAPAGAPPRAGGPQLPPGGRPPQQQMQQLVQAYRAIKTQAARMGVTMQELDKMAGGNQQQPQQQPQQRPAAPRPMGAQPQMGAQRPMGGAPPMGGGAPMGRPQPARMPMGAPGGVR